MMASVYILYTKTNDKYYIGCTKDFEQRLEYHQTKEFSNSFTTKYSDWELYYEIQNLTISVAKKIEAHIKRMKSRIYIENIAKFPEITEKLVNRFS